MSFFHTITHWKAAIDAKRLELAIKTMSVLVSLFRSGRTLYRLVEKSYYTRRIHKTLQFGITIYFDPKNQNNGKFNFLEVCKYHRAKFSTQAEANCGDKESGNYH